jgi:hypothetical protein
VQPLKSQANPEIAALLERFGEPLRDANAGIHVAAKLSSALSSQRPVPPQGDAAMAPSHPVTTAPVANRPGRSKRLSSALTGIVLASTALGLVLFWQDAARFLDNVVKPAEEASVASAGPEASPAPAAPVSSDLEVALSSPERIDADAGQEIDFPIAVDATEALPARSIIAVTALPEGASISEGRPYGVTGWSLRPDEIGGLRLRLPARAGASDMRLELVSGDGAVLAQSETRLGIAPSPAEIATVAVTDNAGPQMAKPGAAEMTGSIASPPPAPQRKPAAAGTHAPVKVTTVKVVPIPAPNPARPHDGGYALGPASEAPPASGEWMATKTAVDMHVKAEQSSATVKVAEGGVKLRVMARDKNWVQVADPASSTTGWIYNRFLIPSEPPAP